MLMLMFCFIGSILADFFTSGILKKRVMLLGLMLYCSHLLIPHGWPHKRGTTVILCVLNICCPWRRLMLSYFDFKLRGEKNIYNIYKT